VFALPIRHHEDGISPGPVRAIQPVLGKEKPAASSPKKLQLAAASKRRGPRNSRGIAMYHTIEFVEELTIDVEISAKHWRERVLIPRGTRLEAQIKPYVVETDAGLFEVADLFFSDGTTTRSLPFEFFSFVD
jgi:hypothetical protein